MEDHLPPHCPEAEKGLLGCCLLDVRKAELALKMGVNQCWFYDARHVEIFKILSNMALNGGGDAMVAAIHLREHGLLENIGGMAYLFELEGLVPSAENFDYY